MGDRFIFRGKSVETGKLIYGSLLSINDKYYIYHSNFGDLDDIDFGFGFAEITEPTQCTGLKDKNGKLIFEGDILKYGIGGHKKEYIDVVKFNEKYSCLDISMRWDYLDSPTVLGIITDLSEHSREWCEVVGNIFETPELFKEKD